MHDHGDSSGGSGGWLRARREINEPLRSLRGLLLRTLGIDVVKEEPHVHDHDDEGLPPDVKRADHRFGGGYLYMARELLVTENDLALLRRELAERGIRLAPGEPEPIGGTRLIRLLLHANERTTVAEVITVLRAIDLGDRDALHVYPNHVLVGASHPRPFPCDSPRAAGPLADPPADGELPGADVRVAVLDSGVVVGHPWLDGRAVPLAAADEEQPDVQNGVLRHSSGHGTFVAGVVLQCAPGAQVVAKKVFDGDGLISDTALAAALRALPDGIQVINLSLGGATHDNVGLPDTQAALQELSRRRPRPVVVAAAGNDDVTQETYPAAFKGVIAVGASQDPDGGRACFSNHGSWVDACAPGRSVHSTFFNVVATPEQIPPGCLPGPPPGQQQFEWFARWSGTSFATPCVAGAIAATMTDQGVDAVEAAFRLVYANGRPHHPEGDLGTIVACGGGVD